MGDKTRDLPSWMLKKDVKQSEQETSFKPHRKTKKTRLERVPLYCMNEAELVETALGLLREAGSGGDRETETRENKTESKKAGGSSVRAVGAVVKQKRKRVTVSDVEEESSDCEAQDRTYVSETDLEELAEAATLPYGVTKARERGGHAESPPPVTVGTGATGASHASGQRNNRGGAPDPGHGDASHGSSDEDALRLVREIFFT
ncbi:uncharacterized protein si:ch211-127m7.2 [Megalops cyprinoides]|uniref:uncharacterized protein si:ch211-127m7.2 n=1 Tax=Megalops cyprinoides TaxID=118141 RepID=UPI001863CC85|nr:uncharacterized protein si:ch211-127m7.2 [Megalops cyprinoides]